MNQSESSAPLWEAVVKYKENGIVPFHTPGHKLHSGVFCDLALHLGSDFLAMDASDELDSVQHDHRFERVLDQAQALAATAFGAAGTLFLVNGSTGGLHASLWGESGQVVIPRFSHQAVYSAALLAARPAVYLPADMDPVWHLPLPPSVEQWQCVLSGCCPSAAVITHPTYYGTVSPLADIAAECRKWRCESIVDEAHGGHFRYHKALPGSAMESGADIAVQSTHKTMGALTGSSMLHCRVGARRERLQNAVQILQTTSPSLPSLAVLDYVRSIWQAQGEEIMQSLWELARSARHELQRIPGISLPPQHADPTKLLFSMEMLGLRGFDVEWILRRDYRIQVEMSDHRWALALLTVGDDNESVAALLEALGDMAVRKAIHGPPIQHGTLVWPDLPEPACDMRYAAASPSVKIPYRNSLGRVSASFVVPYPPGVPLLVPGEIWNKDLIDHVEKSLAEGWHIRGIDQEKAAVLKDKHDF